MYSPFLVHEEISRKIQENKVADSVCKIQILVHTINTSLTTDN